MLTCGHGFSLHNKNVLPQIGTKHMFWLYDDLKNDMGNMGGNISIEIVKTMYI